MAKLEFNGIVDIPGLGFGKLPGVTVGCNTCGHEIPYSDDKFLSYCPVCPWNYVDALNLVVYKVHERVDKVSGQIAYNLWHTKHHKVPRLYCHTLKEGGGVRSQPAFNLVMELMRKRLKVLDERIKVRYDKKEN